MKPVTLVLMLSLVVNVALVVVYWRGSATASPVTAAQKNSARNAVPVARAEDDVAAALREHPGFAAAAQGGDPKRMREALIRAGFPDAYVRDMVTFHISNSVTPERIALLRQQAEKPYWKTQLGEEGKVLQKSLADIDTKNEALAKEVFGGKVPPHPLEAQNQQRRYRFLPPDKAEAVARIDSDYGELEMQSRRGGTATDIREKLRLLQQERRTDLARVLTPQELELYDFTVSPTAESMRRSLVLFQPTQEEFRGLFEIRRPFDEKHGMTYGSLDQSMMQQRAADQQAMNNQARAFLGEQRFLEYQRAQDYGYRAASEIVRHFNLPAANAAETYTLQQSVMKQAREINRAAGSDPAAIAAQIASLLNETNHHLTRLLGAEGADAYKKSGGMWLTSLQRAAAGGAGATSPRQ